MDFTPFVQLSAIGLQARVPMHMTGFPGVGKTEFTKSLEAGFSRAGITCKVGILVGSIRDPQDFGGFPVSTPGGVRLLPMAWAPDAKRLAEDGYLVIVFVLNAAFIGLFGSTVIGVAIWMLRELWSARQPKPITDDFLRLLNESFGATWRNPLEWPWSRLLWAYGFTLVGVVLTTSRRIIVWSLILTGCS
jgi:hypothetical protein